MKTLIAVAIAALFVATPVAWAGSNQGHGAHSGARAMTDGEVRKVDSDAGKVTIKHGPMPDLDMPAMTMVFRVKEAAMLERMKPGDRIRFRAEKIGGAYTVTELGEPAAK